jgi:uncharacterized phage protein (TIGR02218 family)
VKVEDRKRLSALAFCWRIERSDGAGLALTSHDRPLLREGLTYRPDPGVLPATITRSLGLEPHSGEVSGALTAEGLSEADLALGRWHGARVALSAVDWETADEPPLRLMGGELGEVSVNGGSFTAELRGAASRLNEPVCPSTSPECRAEFGDKACRVDLAARTLRARIVESDGTQLKIDRVVDERFGFGRLRYLSGANCGLSTVVLGVTGDAITVRDLPRAPLESGCTVELREGCDKRFETCVNRFANAANFRGEPHLPGHDLLTRYPGS